MTDSISKSIPRTPMLAHQRVGFRKHLIYKKMWEVERQGRVGVNRPALCS